MLEPSFSSEEDFVTVVPIPASSLIQKAMASRKSSSGNDSEGKPPLPTPRQFVTVVSVGGTDSIAIQEADTAILESSLKVTLDVPGKKTDDCLSVHQVLVYRLPGEKLGLGLKFDGGMGVTEEVRRLYIQSTAPDSPAARAETSWGHLCTGDRIMNINGIDVSTMTRVQCVSCLKEARVKLTLGVLKGNGQVPDLEECEPPPQQNDKVRCLEEKKKRLPPPPLPPKGTPRKPSSLMAPPGPTKRQRVLSQHVDAIEKEGSQVLESKSKLPPAPQFYVDLVAEEENSAVYESESDETNSSVSTVIDRISLSSSTTLSRNSSFSFTEYQTKFDLARALSPFEQLEREFSQDKRQKSLSTPHLSSIDQSPTQVDRNTVDRKTETWHDKEDFNGQPKFQHNVKSFSFRHKGRPFTWSKNFSDDDDAVTTTTVTVAKKTMKRPAPNPPADGAQYASIKKPSIQTTEEIDQNLSENGNLSYRKEINPVSSPGMHHQSNPGYGMVVEDQALNAINSFNNSSDSFVSHVSNPSYGLTIRSNEEASMNGSKQESTEGIYEEIQTSESGSEDDNIDSPRSSSSSVTQMPLPPLPVKNNQELSSDTDSDEELYSTIEEDKPFHEYDYIDLNEAKFSDEKPSQNGSSKAVEAVSQLNNRALIERKLSEILASDKTIDEDAQIEIEEEEEVESTIECENEDELKLVLRALRTNNAFSLNDSQWIESLQCYKTDKTQKSIDQKRNIISEVQKLVNVTNGTVYPIKIELKSSKDQDENHEKKQPKLKCITNGDHNNSGNSPELKNILNTEKESSSEDDSTPLTNGALHVIKENSAETSSSQTKSTQIQRSPGSVNLQNRTSRSFQNLRYDESTKIIIPLETISHSASEISSAGSCTNSSTEENQKYQLDLSETNISECVDINASSECKAFQITDSESTVSESSDVTIEDVGDESFSDFQEDVDSSSRCSEEIGSENKEFQINITSDEEGLSEIRDLPDALEKSEEDEQNVSLTLNLYERGYQSPTQDSPPTYSRLPPDGHEFPANYSDGFHDKLSRQGRYFVSNGQFEPVGTRSSSLSSYEHNSKWRRKDERSEKSVKDKIAMFSTEKIPSTAAKGDLPDFGSSVSQPDSKENDKATPEILHKQPRAREPQKKLSAPEPGEPIKKTVEQRTRSVPLRSSPRTNSKNNLRSTSSDTDEKSSYSVNNRRSPSPKISRSPQQTKKHEEKPLSGLNTRSQSLVDIGQSSRPKRHSVGAYDRPMAYKFGLEKPEEKERRTSLNNLIEQRRKSISKLRCLVIPETKVGDCQRVPLDLPKIGSNTGSKTSSLPREDTRSSRLYKTDSISSLDSCSSATSRNSSVINSFNGQPLRKNSSAYSRKYSGGSTNGQMSKSQFRNRSPCSDISTSSPSPRVVSPQRSFEKDRTSLQDSGFESEQRLHTEISQKVSHKSSLGSTSSRIDDSDNDSAVSSTQSSFTHSISPRASPMLDHSDQDDSESFTERSRSSHSTESSFDESDGRRVLKNGTVEAENRRNILKSAKCSSGRTNKNDTVTDSKNQSYDESRACLETKKLSVKRSLQRESSNESGISSTLQMTDSTPRMIEIGIQKETKPCVREMEVKIAYLNEVVDEYEEFKEDVKVMSEVKIPKTTTESPSISNEKWDCLERKYSPIQKYPTEHPNATKASSTMEPEVRLRAGVASQKTDFQSVASKWKQRAEEDSSPPQPQMIRKDSFSKPRKAINITTEVPPKTKVSRLSSSDVQATTHFSERGTRPTNLDIPKCEITDRKFSVPEYSSTVKMRERKDGSVGEVLSRPTSLIEGCDTLNPLQQDSQYMTVPLSPSSVSTDSRDDFVDSSESSSMSRAGSKEVLNAFLKPHIHSVPKMSEIMKAFEKHDFSRKGASNTGVLHHRMSSLDSSVSEDAYQANHYGSVSSLASGQRDQYGSITSLSSCTSIISPQELAQLIEEANHSLEESGTPSHEILVVVLHRELVGHGSIGITLAGGADYETKEITIHKIIPGSLADRDGRIQKGDRVLSINGKTLRGVGHREALNILKSPRPEVVLVLSRSRSVTPQESTATNSNGESEIGFSHRPLFINHLAPARPPKILESPMDSKSLVSDVFVDTVPRAPPQTITLMKDGSGLGFSLEGGVDSPLGDRPLTVKKVFTGGAADKGGILRIGDELRSVNNVDLSNMARIEAWNFLKKLPDGTVTLVIRKKLTEETPKTD